MPLKRHFPRLVGGIYSKRRRLGLIAKSCGASARILRKFGKEAGLRMTGDIQAYTIRHCPGRTEKLQKKIDENGKNIDNGNNNYAESKR